MKAELIVSRTPSGEWHLLPPDDETAQILRDLGEGAIVVDLKRNRNPKFHRYAFQMLRCLHEMSQEPGQFDPWRKWILIKSGHYNTLGLPDGSVLVEPESLAWECMDEAKFREVWRSLHQTWCDVYGNKVSEGELMRWAMM